MGGGWKDYWAMIKDMYSPSAPTDPEPDDTIQPPDLPPPSSNSHRAAFLLDNAATRCMNVLSYQMPEQQFKQIVERCKGWCDTWYAYLSNHGDGNPPITSFYINDEHGGAIDDTKVSLMRDRIKYIRRRGMVVIPWFYADDSRRHVTGKGVAVQNIYLGHACDLFDDLFHDDVVLGLELDEYFDKAMVRALTAHLRGILSDSVRIGQHYTRLNKWGWAVECGADVFYGQYGFGKRPDQVQAMTADVVNKLAGRCKFVAAEYGKNNDSANDKALGDAAITGGAIGTGNGRN